MISLHYVNTPSHNTLHVTPLTYFLQAERVFVDVVLYAVTLGLAPMSNLSDTSPVYMFTVSLLQVELAFQILWNGMMMKLRFMCGYGQPHMMVYQCSLAMQ